MDETKISFGDKLFLYGRTTSYDVIEELGLANPQYNSVMGYIPIGGYYITPLKTDIPDACLPGFVTDMTNPSLASETPFSKMKMVDVTHLLSLQEPSLMGTKVWMPIAPELSRS